MLKITQITKLPVDQSFYIYLSQNFFKKNNIEPFDHVELTFEKNNKKTIVPLITSVSPDLKNSQAEISAFVSRTYDISLNEMFTLVKTSFTNIDTIRVTRKISNIKEHRDKSVIDIEALQFLKKNIRFFPVCDKLIFRINNFDYLLNIEEPALIPHGLIHSETNFKLGDWYINPLENVIGLDEEIEILREMILWPQLYHNKFQELKLQSPKGIILSGVPGVGKTNLVKQLAKSTGYAFYVVRGPEIVGQYYGATEKNLRTLFATAKQNAPAIIFFDELDSISPKRKDAGETDKRMVSQLLTCMDDVAKSEVIVIGSTNEVNSIDPALRRPGRFDRELVIKPPSASVKLKMLEHFTNKKIGKSVVLEKLVEKLGGFVGADLNMLCKEAKLNAIKRSIKDEANVKLEIEQEDFEKALEVVKPSLLREHLRPMVVSLNDLKGYHALKEKIIREITYPVKFKSFYKQYDAKELKGILLHGPPGTGKTTLAQAIAKDLNYNFIGLAGSELLNKYIGETEAGVRAIFSKARYAAPCVIFIDELEAITQSRERTGDPNSFISVSIVGQLLSEMDGLTPNNQVLVIGATNTPSAIDEALLRPSRFDLILEVALPTLSECEEILKFYLEKIKLDPDMTSENIKKLAIECKNQNFAGADIKSIVKDALNYRIGKTDPKILNEIYNSDNKVPIGFEDLKEALAAFKIRKSFKIKGKTTTIV